MSKERLEEAGEWLSSMYDLLSLKTDKEDRAYTQKRIDLFNWLIEQAERFEVLSEQHDEALMQNKRYREAIEEVLSIENYGVATDYIKVITNILLDALEESS